jgi:hypothetical protein
MFPHQNLGNFGKEILMQKLSLTRLALAVDEFHKLKA